jgi:chain length determinant protein (polysaccharide antigen chain regulator)
MRNEPERRGGSEEIDLVELLQGVWRQKYWALMVMVPVLAAGFAYAMLATPAYEAKLYVQSPSQNDIAQLNYGRGGDSGLSMLTVKDVYEAYIRALQSETVRNNFFRTVYLPSLSEEEKKSSRDGLYAEFGAVLKVALVTKDSPTRYVITASTESPQQAASWVVAYAEMASHNAKREVIKSSQSEMLVKASNLERQLVSAKASARKERKDQIAQLNEALTIAKSIGLEKPPLISGALSTEISAGMNGSLSYMRGSKALEAEIANLELRSSDDPFIKGLREKQEALVFYRNLNVDPAVVSVFQQDGVVEQPDRPVKPRKVLIGLLSIVVALGSGLVAALIREMWAKRERSLS